MPNENLSTAIKEAYASALTGRVKLDTLELSHDDWDEALHLVRDHQDLIARLEDGSEVTFAASAFDLTLPELKTSSVSQVIVTLDNVAGDMRLSTLVI